MGGSRGFGHYHGEEYPKFRIEEHHLQAYRKTTKTPIRETPFQLAYGSEVVIPAKVGLMSYRLENHDESKNDEAMCLQLNLVDEVRATAEQRFARYQNLMAKYYNSKVRHRDFQLGDLVLKKVIGTANDVSQGKLGPNWEGPYKITSWHRKGTYYLETLEGQKLHHPWNTEHLKKYYQYTVTKTTITSHSSIPVYYFFS
ncbi:uncharacterized protein LOC142616563 [Castanea sativa]|uniref:uncharacterized protein LOC142616563 n=1 Tax=Castanea sativa TaxID=21020 RepID=UPI003F64B7A4